MRIVVTGGAGFCGFHFVRNRLLRGDEVLVYDNLSRKGVEHNLEELQSEGHPGFSFQHGDVRDAKGLALAIGDADAVVHLAAQVAVTTSIEQPIFDFEVNAAGTLNVLEAVRHRAPHATLIYASTNKVYGGLEHAGVYEGDDRYHFVAGEYQDGVRVDAPLDFHSPYGCSKGTGDQYVRDYARIYGLRTVVLRQSCIYGPNQFGMVDQGWLAHFAISMLAGRKITIYGDGKQVRDLLYIDDLVRLYDLLLEPDGARGQVYNVGGGPTFSRSVLYGVKGALEAATGEEFCYDQADWRPGDQRVYISNIGPLGRDLGWIPTVNVDEGLTRMVRWLKDHREVMLQ
jgi:CDP-paratose 2-epimerase